MSSIDLTATVTRIGVLRLDFEGRWPVDHFVGLLSRLDRGYSDAGQFLLVAREPDLVDYVVQEQREAHGDASLEYHVRRGLRHLGDPSTPQLLAKSLHHESPGWVEVLGAWNPLKVIADFMSQWRAENSARTRDERESEREGQRQQMAYYLQLLDRMDPEVRDLYAVDLLEDARTASRITASDPRIKHGELREATDEEAKQTLP